MAEPEEEINEITESTRHALDQDADEETPPVSNTWERCLNAASKAPNVSVFERHTLDNKVFNKPVFSANTIKEVKTGEPQKPRADIILNALTNPTPTSNICGPESAALKKIRKKLLTTTRLFSARCILRTTLN